MMTMAFDFQPELSGPTLLLRPLRADDFDAVFAAAADPLIWELHPAKDRHIEAKFRAYFEDRLASGGTSIISDRATGDCVGWSSYGGFLPDQSEIEIGWTFLTRSHWGGAVNRELKHLMLAHAFRFVDVATFRVAATNKRSRGAMEKIGGRLIDRPAEIVFEGVTIPHVVYTIEKADFEANW
jgi:RimJ/RimL family protein N-acetyltransferase